jgi:3-oxoacyl-[acyl-carrier protein] reductase
MDRSEPNSPAVKTALVTGGSRGIGRAIVLALAEDGWHVAVGYRSSDLEAKETLEGAESAGGTGVTVRLDTRDESSVIEAFREAAEVLGPVVGLVNNAGLSVDGLAIKYPMDTFEDVMATNVRGSFLCARSALRSMLKAKWGRIVNVSSAVALRGNAGQTVYAASKTALAREILKVETSYGPVAVKVGTLEDGGVTLSPEFEDCARLAREFGVPAREVHQEAVRRAREEIDGVTVRRVPQAYWPNRPLAVAGNDLFLSEKIDKLKPRSGMRHWIA